MSSSEAEYEPLHVDENGSLDAQAVRPTRFNRSHRNTWRRIAICASIFALAIFIFGFWSKTSSSTSSGTSAAPEGIETVGSIEWTSCEPEVENIECGSVVVPKDYFNQTTGTARIAIARYKAKKDPRKGTVFMNPGGPGHPGRSLALEKGEEMANIIGEDWDLVGFDPRGVGKSTPTTRCFPDTQTYRSMFANTVVERGISIPSTHDLSSPELYQSLVQQYAELIALKQTQGETCKENMGDELRYMGTSTVARDVDFMSRILEGSEAKINYWGESYGTVLGTHLVNMFPSRVGYVVIDGVVDPVVLTHEPTYKWPSNWLSDAEKTYETFLKACTKAGPVSCRLSKFLDEPWTDIRRRIDQFFDETYLHPIPVPLGNRPGVLTSGTARALLSIALQGPKHWPVAAQRFALAMEGNATDLYNLYAPPPDTLHVHPPFTPDLQRQAVTCLDAPPSQKPYPTAHDLADEGLRTLREVSVRFGVSTGVSEPDGGCEYWPVQAADRFDGPFGKANGLLDKEKPMLIIGNTADPITPLSSAEQVHSLLPDSSVLVIQDGPGHCSTSFPSKCIEQIQRDYFQGKIPKNGTVCKMDRNPFP